MTTGIARFSITPRKLIRYVRHEIQSTRGKWVRMSRCRLKISQSRWKGAENEWEWVKNEWKLVGVGGSRRE